MGWFMPVMMAVSTGLTVMGHKQNIKNIKVTKADIEHLNNFVYKDILGEVSNHFEKLPLKSKILFINLGKSKVSYEDLKPLLDDLSNIK